jgi:hypothetical protein
MPAVVPRARAKYRAQMSAEGLDLGARGGARGSL